MTYRSDGDAWLLQREELAHALASEGDLDARERMIDALAAMDRACRIEARRHLPLVASAKIASPCHEPFEAMLGEGALRSCTRCDKEVFDLAQMTLAQAEALVTSRREGGVCVRLHKRRDGTMMFADCTVGASGVRTKRVAAVAAVALVASSVLAVLTHPMPIALHAPIRAPRPTRGSGIHYAPSMGEMEALPPQPMAPFSSLDPGVREAYGS